MNDAEALAGLELRVPAGELAAAAARACSTATTWSAAGSRRPAGEAVGDVTAVEGDMGTSRLVVAVARTGKC